MTSFGSPYEGWSLMFFLSLGLLSMTIWGATGPSIACAESAVVQTPVPADIEVFVREGCPHCVKAKEFLAELVAERGDLRIVI